MRKIEKLLLSLLCIASIFVSGVHISIKEVSAQNKSTLNILNEMENELDEEGIDVEVELQEQIQRYQQLLNESDEEKEQQQLTGIINETYRLLEAYLSYRSANLSVMSIQSSVLDNLNHKAAVAMGLAYFCWADCLLSSELLTHMSENTQIYSIYHPKHGYLVEESIKYNQMLQSADESGSVVFETENAPIKNDLAYSLHAAEYRKPTNNFLLVISDIYDFAYGNYTGIKQALINGLYSAQEAGAIKPYHVEILLTTGYVGVNQTKQVNINTKESKRYYEDVAILRGTDNYKEYMITFEDSGVKLIQTFGQLRTRMFIYDENGMLITATSDDGYNGNTAYWLSAEAGKTYRVRIRCKYSSDRGTTRLTITPAKRVKDSSADSLTQYEDIYSVTNTTNFTFTSYAQKFVTAVITFTPPQEGVYTLELESIFNNYAYIIDPTISRPIRYEGENFHDIGNFGSSSMITSKLKAGIPYLIIYSHENLETDFINYDEGDDLIVKIRKQN